MSQLRDSISETASFLQPLLAFLKENEIQYTLQNASQHVPFDIVVLSVGVTDEDQPIVLQIHSYQQELTIPEGAESEQEKRKSLGILHILNFLLTHPTKLTQKCLVEVYRLVMLANKSLPMGALMISEQEMCCYYQFALPSTTEIIQPATFQAIFNTILFAKEIFFDVIEDVITGKASVEDIVASLQKENQSTPQVQ